MVRALFTSLMDTAQMNMVVDGSEFSEVFLTWGSRREPVQESLDHFVFYHSYLERERHVWSVVEFLLYTYQRHALLRVISTVASGVSVMLPPRYINESVCL